MEELWARQYQLTSLLLRAKVSQILEGLVDLSFLADATLASSSWVFAQHWGEQEPELERCSKVDAIKAGNPLQSNPS